MMYKITRTIPYYYLYSIYNILYSIDITFLMFVRLNSPTPTSCTEPPCGQPALAIHTTAAVCRTSLLGSLQVLIHFATREEQQLIVNYPPLSGLIGAQNQCHPQLSSPLISSGQSAINIADVSSGSLPTLYCHINLLVNH